MFTRRKLLLSGAAIMAAKAAEAAGGGLKMRRGKPGAALTIAGTPVLTGQSGVAYAGFVVTATGGRAPYTYSVFSGSLPTGITLNASTGVVSGTPSVDGSFPDIIIRVTDSVSATANLAGFTLVISAASSFTVANQAADFGALTLANAGGYQVVASDTIASASITGGTLSVDGHCVISASGIITRNVVAWTSGTLIVRCVDGSGNVASGTVTITAIASAYSIASDSEGNTVFALGDATISGKTVYCRYADGTVYGAMNNFGRFKSLTSVLTITSHDHANMAIWQRFQIGASTGTVGNITLSYLAFYRPYAQWGGNNMIVLGNTVSAHDITIDHCTFLSDLVAGRLGGTVYQGIYRYFIGVGTAGFSNLSVTNCEASFGVHFVSFTGTGLTLTGNHVHDMWGDFLNLTPQSNGNTTGTILVENNQFHDPIANMNLLHPDFIQAFAFNQVGSGAINDLTVLGNVVFPGFEGENALSPVTGPLLDFMLMQTAGATVTFANHTVEGNVAYLFTIHGITYEGVLSGTSVLRNNSFLRYWSAIQDEAHGFHTYEYPQVRGNFSGAGITIQANACEDITIVSGSPTLTNNNTSATKTLVSYEALYQGTSFEPFTRTDALNEARMLIGGPLDVGSIGAVGTTTANGFYNFDAGHIN